MNPRRCLAAWLLVSSLVSSGCATSPEPQFYTLFPRAGQAWPDRPLEVQLQRPGLPGHLDRPQIVRHEQPGKLEFSGADRWGAPLDGMIGSILVQNLAQRLPKASVYGESGAISSSPDALVEVDVQRFELTERGSVELVAQVAVHWPKTDAPARIDRYSLNRSPTDRSTARLVTEMSGLLAELANAIARKLREGPPPPPAAADTTREETSSGR
jgi:uncharacterized lipoprotein YmbA